jgi:hypothetical protein
MWHVMVWHVGADEFVDAGVSEFEGSATAPTAAPTAANTMRLRNLIPAPPVEKCFAKFRHP